jgi:hypothetical protein
VAGSQENREGLESKKLSGFLLNSHWHEYFLVMDKEAALQLLVPLEGDLLTSQAKEITTRLLHKLEGLIPQVSRRNRQSSAGWYRGFGRYRSPRGRKKRGGLGRNA